ncbi:Carbon monoxide-responsive transcriptional activator CooA [Dissulfuribacter thermophilus]|uniref:Carbon monoxide-responsive transcriptional activator CooA n=1 Tax=Dissulfuribacter thermophilus TaxID=1156395 RepID=A0A1B9F4K6_9BACT|nr:Crp/Fnr family transcriptional regulator [Dissulfuribacter thermophilus]OCC14868.1 Carbon monoxide-responsive transcriptional activator CooA [Dissulfuribacter thermophilus]
MRKKFSTINILDEICSSNFDQICQNFSEINYSKGQLIYDLDHNEDLIFIVKKGKIRIYLALEDKEFSLAILEPGDIYSTHTRAYVEAVEDVTLLTMPTEKFHLYIATHSALSRTIISVLGELLKQSFSIIENLVFNDISGRLINFFLQEARESGQVTDEGIILNLDLTMEQLATIVSASRQTVSTIVNSMQRANILQKQRRGVFLIPDLDRLKNFSTF